MFIEQHRLESNPFAVDSIRPYFTSQSVRHARRKLDQLKAGQIQCAFLTGPAGVGKSALTNRLLDQPGELLYARLDPTADSADVLYTHLVRNIGPGPVEGNAGELRNILEVYLMHQAGKGVRTLIVVDALDRQAAEVLRECEYLAWLRYRNRPVVQFLYLSRNEDLIHSMMQRHEGGTLARAVHVRLSGFGLDETSSYIRSVLHGAGCTWHDEVFPEDALLDVQGFTRGVVGDVDALCRGALDRVAESAARAVDGPQVSRAILKEVGKALHFRYDARAWRRVPEETLSPNAIRQRDPADLHIEAARLLVSSGGQTVAEISLNRPRMVLGRDDNCDVSLNSNYVSRYQNLFMETGEGWLLIDLNSTNGSFVNGQQVREHYLRDGDLISIGQHQLRFAGVSRSRDDADASDPTAVRPALVKSSR